MSLPFVYFKNVMNIVIECAIWKEKFFSDAKIYGLPIVCYI